MFKNSKSQNSNKFIIIYKKKNGGEHSRWFTLYVILYSAILSPSCNGPRGTVADDKNERRAVF